MTRGNSSQKEEIKKYLFQELTQTEREKIEEKFFVDSDYFYDVMELENDLADKYALGTLEGDELQRFEKSLKVSPERREKIASAVALQRRIAEEKQTAAETAQEKTVVTVPAKVSLREQLSSFFSWQASPFQYAVAGLMILLTAGFGFLLLDPLRVGQELAALRESRGGIESQQREKDLQEQIQAAQTREAELKRQIESERGESALLNEQLEREASEREKAERELERLRREQNKPPPLPTPQSSPRPALPSTPTIASVFLLPGGRGSGSVKEVIIGKNTKRIAIGLELEEGIKLDGRLSVEINSQTVATDLQPKSLPSGKQIITVSVSPQGVVNGVNKIVVKNVNNLLIGDYELQVRKR